MVVLHPAEALLLGGRDNFSVAHQRGGTVVIEGGNAQYPHGAQYSEQSVNERRHSAALRQQQEHAKQQHRHQDG